MTAPDDLVTCPTCGSLVSADRLQRKQRRPPKRSMRKIQPPRVHLDADTPDNRAMYELLTRKETKP